MSWPAYLETYESGELARRTDEALEMLRSCSVCPRDCHVNRLRDETKVCNVGRHARVSSAFPHRGEEDCLRGWNGSGTIFFSWCNLKCVFCQNWEVSNEGAGHEVDAISLAGLMLDLQARGCHNINFVTPEHVVPQVMEALLYAIDEGLRLPIVYNTSGYDSLHSLRLLDGVVDIYMPDFKYWDPDKSHEILKARDYPERTREAIAEMQRQVGPLTFDDEGLAKRGVLVRHLVMPDELDETRAILRWLHELHPDTYVNVLEQYYPAGRAAEHPERFPTLSRRLTRDEHREAVAAAESLGLRVDRRRALPFRF